jgi:hypothetical protein
MKILVCTIVRDSASASNYWASNLQELAAIMSDCEFSISLYENDSKDNSPVIFKANLKKLRNSELFKDIFFLSDHIGTAYYDSGNTRSPSEVESRLQNLSNARNKCLENMLQKRTDFDKIIFIEPDVNYNPSEAASLIRESVNKDIYCGFSLLFGTKDILYDSWATRLDYELIPLDMDNHANWNQHHRDIVDYFKNSEDLVKVKSAFSGFCIYSAKALVEDRIRFSYKRGDIYDCDTALICLDYVDKGYEEIFLSKKMRIYHFN